MPTSLNRGFATFCDFGSHIGLRYVSHGHEMAFEVYAEQQNRVNASKNLAEQGAENLKETVA